MIMPEPEACGDVTAELAEVLTYTLTDRLESFEACGTFYGVNTDALGRAVIDRREYGHLSVSQCDGCSRVGTPHLVRLFSNDAAFVGIAVHRGWPACWREQLCGPHQSQNTLFRGADASMAEPRPDLPMPLTKKRPLANRLADMVR